MRPKLYQFEACPFSNKVKAVLRYKGVDFDVIEVNPMNKKELEFSPDYKKVPIYVDEQGNQINGSTEILRYIERFHANPRVFETDPEKEKIEAKWMDWADNAYVRGIPPLIYRSFTSAFQALGYLVKTDSFSFFEKIYLRLFGAFFMGLKGKKLAKKYGIEDTLKNFKEKLEVWAQVLKEQPFLCGNKPNGADFSVFGYTKSIENLPIFQEVKSNKRFYQWYQDMRRIMSP